MKNEEETRRSEKAGLLNFTREMVSALLMAFVAIVYVIQAFKIPTGSMERSLLVGDFLLGLKFLYGAPVLPFAYARLPGVTKPKPGDVIIFEYPGADFKDYIKRCVAGPGQTLEVHGKNLIVDGKRLNLPPNGQYQREGDLGPQLTDFAAVRVPAKGDTLDLTRLPIREFLYAKHLIKQENPRARLAKFLESNFITRGVFRYKPESERVKLELRLFLDSVPSNDAPIDMGGMYRPLTISLINGDPRLNAIDDWRLLSYEVDQLRARIESAYPDRSVRLVPVVRLDGDEVSSYVVKYDNYFMMGDNRDNSADSRFWGFVNYRHVKAKAFIIYFSWADVYREKDYSVKMFKSPSGKMRPRTVPSLLLPVKIRWRRVGKLIRPWEGV